ncbi:hypothetical protein CPL00259L_CDS0015 [Escherichia phage McMelon]
MGRGPRRCLSTCCAVARQREGSRSLHRLLHAMAHRIWWRIRHRLRRAGVVI